MDYSLHLNRWHYRQPDWLAAVVAGLAGGAVMMVLELLWTAATNEVGPWRASQLVAAMVLGPGVLFGIVATGFGIDRQVPAMLVFGALFGALLYVFDFYGMVRFFPWFIEIRGWAMAIGNVVFGMVAALLYAKLERGERMQAGLSH